MSPLDCVTQTQPRPAVRSQASPGSPIDRPTTRLDRGSTRMTKHSPDDEQPPGVRVKTHTKPWPPTMRNGDHVGRIRILPATCHAPEAEVTAVPGPPLGVSPEQVVQSCDGRLVAEG